MIPPFSDFFVTHHITDRQLAVGVSGGSDSLALVLMLWKELAPLGYRIVALTVDHQLRPSSAKEASYVAEIMKKFHIEHHILVWNGEKPRTGIEEAARQARYQLIGRWCAENQIRTLVLAHQQEDQAETFLMRLQRGSGLEGLCAIRPVCRRNNLLIVRPLLDTSKAELQSYLALQNIRWIEDESNLSDDYLRNRIRHALPMFYAQTGINAQILCDTAKRLQKTQALLDRVTERHIHDLFSPIGQVGFSCLKTDWSNLDSELHFCLLKKILPQLAQTDYPPRAKSLTDLCLQMDSDHFKSATLGGCEILAFDNRLWFVRETKHIVCSQQQWKSYLENHPTFKKVRLPHKVRLALFAYAA
jgi:tRNA(Ile)-lysidine synthase